MEYMGVSIEVLHIGHSGTYYQNNHSIQPLSKYSLCVDQ